MHIWHLGVLVHVDVETIEISTLLPSFPHSECAHLLDVGGEHWHNDLVHSTQHGVKR